MTCKTVCSAVGLLAALPLLLGNAGGRASVAGVGNTGAPGENAQICVTCHNGGAFGAIIELLEITDAGGNLVATYRPGQTYNVVLTIAAGAGNPAGFGFQLTALDNARANVGTWMNLGGNVKTAVANNTGNRLYLENKGGTSATGVFTAKWKAPAAGNGDVDFYYIGAVVNGNNAMTLDNGGLGSTITLSEFRLPRPYFEDFEFGDGGWMTYPDPGGPTASTSWEHGAPQGMVIGGASSGAGAWVTGLGGATGGAEHSYLESPPIDMSTETTDAVIQFMIQYDTEAGFDGGWLELSTDGGQSWWNVGGMGTGTGWYDGMSMQYGDWWDGASGGWRFASHELWGTAGMPDVRVRFVFVGDGSSSFEGIAIDDVSIDEGFPEEPPPEEEPPQCFVADAVCMPPEEPPPEEEPPYEEPPYEEPPYEEPPYEEPPYEEPPYEEPPPEEEPPYEEPIEPLACFPEDWMCYAP